MIENILNIKNLWRFKSFVGSSDDLKFKKNTFIFWKNTHWKSTFSAIFNSFYKKNADFLIWRKTFWTTTSQEIKLKIDTWNIVFNWSSWDKDLNVKVFDSHYISENIYNNDLLDETKQWKIANLILWEEWKIKEIEYNDAKNNCDKNSKRRKEITNAYNSVFDKSILTFKQFRKLDWLDKNLIETELKEKKKILESYKNQEKIKNILKKIKISLNSINNIDINWLDKTLDINWTIIKEHIAENISDKNNAISYLSSWIKLLKNDNCSFCWQKLEESAKKLISELNTLFSQNYKDLNNKIKEVTVAHSNLLIEESLLTAKSELINYWIDMDITLFITSYKNEFNKFTKELDRKKENLNYIINLDILEEMKILSLDFFNNNITSLQKKYEKEIDVNEKTKIENEIKLLEIKVKRNDKVLEDLSSEYSKLEIDYDKNLKPKEEKTFNERKKYAKKVLNEYEDWINSILDKLWANFKLTDFSIPENRRSQLSLFSLKFNNHIENIPLNSEENKSNLKNTLSESDKRLLAFAFFITDIKKIDNLDEYIIVLDDPMSSLDSERKLSTINLMRDVINNNWWKKYNQLIVLTHEENFFKFLNQQFQDEKKLLQIKYNNTTKNAELIECNINEEFLKEPHFKMLDDYHKCINDDDFSECNLNNIRIILEHIIDRKYYINIDGNKRNSWWILKWYYDFKVSESDIKIKLSDIFPNISHHDQVKLKDWDFSEWDKKTIIKNLFELIKLL